MTSLLFKATEFGVETVQLENSRKIHILKHNNTSANLSDAFPPSSPLQELGWGGG